MVVAESLDGMAKNLLEKGTMLDFTTAHISKVDLIQHRKTHTAMESIRQRGIRAKIEGIY